MAGVPSEVLLGDRDRLFADWGVTVTYRQVSREFDPESQSWTETFTDSAMTGIPSGERRDGDTAGQGGEPQISFQLKSEEVPESPVSFTSRMVYGGTSYDIVSVEVSAMDQMTRVRCRTRE